MHELLQLNPIANKPDSTLPENLRTIGLSVGVSALALQAGQVTLKACLAFFDLDEAIGKSIYALVCALLTPDYQCGQRNSYDQNGDHHPQEPE
jgi:hypothetical protein